MIPRHQHQTLIISPYSGYRILFQEMRRTNLTTISKDWRNHSSAILKMTSWSRKDFVESWARWKVISNTMTHWSRENATKTHRFTKNYGPNTAVLSDNGKKWTLLTSKGQNSHQMPKVPLNLTIKAQNQKVTKCNKK